ncbi:hypothetical protein PP653_gp006 [Bacillus phage Basilisk]|uniref:Uncharacterized protein n=1 Tax=Bacillus phage Basilisk TaxID=1296654 RepID=S5MS97_9CAUD|nr:hypothetical protein PP653_gp006 [Bacillus phage Basilisk]AGR46672.1 hypothetical protein BASILISK_6 [Bacillus phage Basilisk]
MTNMSKYEIGQMVQLDYETSENKYSWQYMVVVDVFDDKVLFDREYGGRFMLTIAEPKEGEKAGNLNRNDIGITPLYKNGKKVFSKRSFFGLGRYTFEPTTKG